MSYMTGKIEKKRVMPKICIPFTYSKILKKY